MPTIARNASRLLDCWATSMGARRSRLHRTSPLPRPLTRSLTHSLTHSFTTHPLPYSLTYLHSAHTIHHRQDSNVLTTNTNRHTHQQRIPQHSPKLLLKLPTRNITATHTRPKRPHTKRPMASHLQTHSSAPLPQTRTSPTHTLTHSLAQISRFLEDMS